MSNLDSSVRVFLSSTFMDFHDERNHLVKQIFPELRRRLRERFVELIDVDLRWGITTEEAENGKVLPICLAEIDKARPYFIGMIGDRYGWIPDKDKYPTYLIQEHPWLTDHLNGKSVTELEIIHGVLNNPDMSTKSLFYFRESKAINTETEFTGSETDRSEKDRLISLKQKIIDAGLSVKFYDTPETLGAHISRDLWALLEDDFPEEKIQSKQNRETSKHHAYSYSRRFYIGGKLYINSIDRYIQAGIQKILIEGVSGIGKSALLANWSEKYKKENPDDLVFEHYLGASKESADPANLVERLSEFFKAVVQSTDPVATNDIDLFENFGIWLEKGKLFCEQHNKRLILVIDSLNSLSRFQDLQFLPDILPGNIYIVVSVLHGKVRDALLSKTFGIEHTSWTRINLLPLARGEREVFIHDFLKGYTKKLPESLIKKIAQHKLSSIPIFLKILLEELRVFGKHEQLSEKISENLKSRSIDSLFEKILQRLEDDFGERNVASILKCIYISQFGLTEKDILYITGISPSDWTVIRNSLSDSIMESNGKINFAHDYIRNGVKRRYLASREMADTAKYDFANRMWEIFLASLIEPNLLEECIMSELGAQMIALRNDHRVRVSKSGDPAKILNAIECIASSLEGRQMWPQFESWGEFGIWFAQKNSGDIYVQQKESQFLTSLSRHYRTRGKKNEAYKLQVKAFKILKALHFSHPDNKDISYKLARSYRFMGEILMNDLGLLSKAEKMLFNYLKTIRKLHRQYSSEIGYKAEISTCFHFIGDILQKNGQPQKGLSYFLKAKENNWSLIATNPLNVNYWHEHAFSCRLAGENLQTHGKDSDRVIDLFKASCKSFEKFLELIPEHNQVNLELLVSRSRIGRIYIEQGDLDAAEVIFENLRSYAKKLSWQDPTSLEWIGHHSFSLKTLGEINLKKSHIKKAENFFLQAERIYEERQKEDPNNTVIEEKLFELKKSIENLKNQHLF